MTVALLRRINDHGVIYHGLFIWCPGCDYVDTDDGKRYGGLHMLPVSGSSKKRSRWQFDGNFEKPTISPSILTKFERGEEKFICHSFVRNGVWQFLTDSTHDLAGKHVQMVDLPWWVTDA